ncbi:hypothetical protein [Kitasatospora phosalacinea]|uniref:hypothetical protein n=1 Tax=Kitasatospora phosalacinea TaxID=2065 RepID=UPI0005244868|nr:hypothetical protein [Kitasatospora phosalacinea]
MNTDRRPLWQPFSETATQQPLHPRDGQRPAPATASPFLEPGPTADRAEAPGPLAGRPTG